MSAGKKDIVIEQGVDFNANYQWMTLPPHCPTSMVNISGAPIDITGSQVDGFIFSGYGPYDSLIADFTCSVVNASAGIFNVYLPAISSAAFTIRESQNDFTSPYYQLGYYQIEITNGPKLVEGAVVLEKAGPTAGPEITPYCDYNY